MLLKEEKYPICVSLKPLRNGNETIDEEELYETICRCFPFIKEFGRTFREKLPELLTKQGKINVYCFREPLMTISSRYTVFEFIIPEHYVSSDRFDVHLKEPKRFYLYREKDTLKGYFSQVHLQQMSFEDTEAGLESYLKMMQDQARRVYNDLALQAKAKQDPIQFVGHEHLPIRDSHSQLIYEEDKETGLVVFEERGQ